MKKIVILGGGENQLPLIKAAKELGYYVILCDFRQTVEGISLSDIHYQINTLSYDEVYSVCKIENPNGIISNSEPAMPIVAKISEAFGFIGNSEESINTLMSKNKFRSLQKKIGCFCPQYFEIENKDNVWQIIDNIKYPFIIKPAQSSGSRGFRRIDSFNKEIIEYVCDECFRYTTNKKIVIEEYIEMPSLTTIEGDIFIHNGKILFDGIFSTTRAEWASFVPMTYTAPAVISRERLNILHKLLENILKAANITHGEYNFEGYFNNDNECFIIEINVRQGGHEIPLLIKDFLGIDYTKLLVSTAVGDDTYWDKIKNVKPEVRYIIKQTTFSKNNGYYKNLYINPIIKENVYRTIEYKKEGETVEKCINGQSLCAIVDLEFSNREKQIEVYESVNDLIKIETIQN